MGAHRWVAAREGREEAPASCSGSLCCEMDVTTCWRFTVWDYLGLKSSTGSGSRIVLCILSSVPLAPSLLTCDFRLHHSLHMGFATATAVAHATFSTFWNVKPCLTEAQKCPGWWEPHPSAWWFKNNTHRAGSAARQHFSLFLQFPESTARCF